MIFADSCGREKETDRQLMPPPMPLLDKGFPQSDDQRHMYGPSAPLGECVSGLRPTHGLGPG